MRLHEGGKGKFRPILLGKTPVPADLSILGVLMYLRKVLGCAKDVEIGIKESGMDQHHCFCPQALFCLLVRLSYEPVSWP